MDTVQMAVLSRLFSAGVLREMAELGRSPLFARLLSQLPALSSSPSDARVADAFESAFSALSRRGCRDEYVYRTALVEKVLLGRHSLRTASMLSEFRVGTSKADVVILNGTTTVYEIKSERDSLARLGGQIENYRKVFANVYVIAAEDHVQSVLDATPSAVGVQSLNSRYQISTVREATEHLDQICPATVLESLRVPEACAVLAFLGVEIPHVPNTRLHGALRERFEVLEPAAVHQAMLRVLWRSRNLAPLSNLVGRLPRSLRAAALSVSLRSSDHERLVQATQTSLNTAMTWGV